MRPKILKAIAIFFFVLLLLILGISVFLQTDYSRKIIKRLVEESVSSATNQTLTIGKVETDLIRGVKLKNVLLRIEGEPFVQLEEASVKYSLPLVINRFLVSKKVITLNDIALRGLDVNLIQYKDGKWNFNKIGEKEEKKEEKENKQQEPSDWNIIFQNFLLKNAEIKVENRMKDEITQIEIPTVNLSIKMIGMTNKIELDLKDASLRVSPQKIQVKGLSTKASYTDQGARIENLKASFNGAVIKLDAVVSDFKQPEFEIRASAYGYKVKEVGVLNAEIEGSGKYRSPRDIQARLNILMPDSQIRGKKVLGSIEKITMDGTKIEVNNVTVKTEFGETSLDGNVNLERILTKEGINEFNLYISLKELETPEIFALLEEEEKPDVINKGLNAKLNANFDVNGSWKEIDDLKAKVNIDRFQLEEMGAGEVDLKGVVEATKSNVEFDLTSNLNKVNLASILGEKKYASKITSNLNLKGSVPLGGDLLDSLTASVEAKILPSSFSDIKIKQGVVNASYAESTLSLKNFSITSDVLKLKVEGTRTEKKGVNINYDVEVNDLNFISRFSPELDLEGSLKANGKVEGELKNPQVTFSAVASDFGYKEDIRIESIDLDGEGVVDLENPEFQLKGNLEKLKIQDRNIENLNIQAKSEGKGVRGNIAILENPERSYKIELKLADLKSREKGIELNKVKFDLKDNVIENKDTIDVAIAPQKLIVKSFNLYYKEGSVIGDADVAFNGNVDASLELNQLNLAGISELFELDPPIKGVTSGNLSLTGTVWKPIMKANISAQNLGSKEFKTDETNLNLSYLDKELDLNLNATQNSREILLISGGANVDLNLRKLGDNIKNATFNIAIRSDGFELSPIAALNKEIKKIEGKLTADLRASGNVKNPRIQGRVSLQKVSLRIQSLEDELKIPTMLLEMQGEKAFLRTLEIRTGDEGIGTFEGEADLRELSYDLRGRMDGLEIKPERISAKLSGNVEVKGSDEKVDVRGDLEIPRLRYQIAEKTKKELEEIKFVDDREEREELKITTTEDKDYFKENVALGLKVSIPGNAWVRGKGANVELEGNLRVNKEYGQPLILMGNIDTVRGTYAVLGRLFEIEEGTVSFQGTPKINPFLDIQALYEVSDVDVFVNIGGTVEKPEVKLTSDPPMEETDIFSYLIFGTSSNKIGAGERVSLQARAAAALGNLAAGKLQGLVGDEFSPDVIRIRAGESGPQVELGKYLTDDLYIAFERSPTDSVTTIPSVTNKVRVEYRLFDFLTLESDVGGEQAGGDVFFKFDYSCPLL